eukprot:9185437-Lingulodinium_polyedra.AAC.1
MNIHINKHAHALPGARGGRRAGARDGPADGLPGRPRGGEEVHQEPVAGEARGAAGRQVRQAIQGRHLPPEVAALLRLRVGTHLNWLAVAAAAASSSGKARHGL